MLEVDEAIFTDTLLVALTPMPHAPIDLYLAAIGTAKVTNFP